MNPKGRFEVPFWSMVAGLAATFALGLVVGAALA